MATQNFINECKNRANANRLAKFDLEKSKNFFNKYGNFTYGQGYNVTSLNEQNQIVSRSNFYASRSKGQLIENLLSNTNYSVSGTLISANGTNTNNVVIQILTTSNQNIRTSVINKNVVKPYNFQFTFNTGENTSIWISFNGFNNSASGDTETIFDNIQIKESETIYEINQTNHLTSIELKDSCYVNDTIIGSIYTKSAEVKLLNLPIDTELVGETITPEIGVRYTDDSTEYITFDDYIIESVNDEQTASNTKFTAMNGGTLLDEKYVCSLSFEDGATHTINEFYQDACQQIGLTPTDTTFDNSEIIMTGNPFTNNETIRTVLSEVEKVSCSIIKFDWANETISLTWLSDEIDYEFNTSDYSTLEGSMTQYGPLNVIILGNSQLDGENVVMTDEESVEENGEHQIMIDSPYFLYNEMLRNQAIEAIYNKLDGLTYYDLKLTTPYGKPFLEIGNKIRINTNENQVYDTYVLTHTFTYDGAFQSIIESPALTTQEQTVKNEFKGNSVKERLKRTEVIVDKTTGDITALTQRVETTEDEIGNMYTKEQTNELVQNATSGLTNTFRTTGGNNIFRNTGLWFETKIDENLLYPSDNLYPSDDLFIEQKSTFEFWRGDVVRETSFERAVNFNALLLQAGTLFQEQNVPNNKTYTVSFKYQKLKEAPNVKVVINDKEIPLTALEETEFQETIQVSSGHINVQFITDVNNSCRIYDLMVNAGDTKAPYSQNENETTTDTVNISKGITITSSDNENIIFKANYDGVRIYDKNDMVNPKTKFTDKGTETDYLKVKEEAQIVDILIQRVGSHTWLTKI